MSFDNNLISNINDNGILNASLVVNVILHVVILYTILANIFMYFVTDITSKVMNDEIKHLIDDSFKPYLDNKENIQTKIRDLKNKYKELENQLNTVSSLQNITNESKLNDLLTQIKNLEFLASSLPVPNNIGFHFIPSHFNFNYFKNISFDYYLDLYKDNDITRKMVNSHLFSQVKFINILLVLFLLIVVGVLFLINALSAAELLHILLENVVTFIFVGIIEILFFFNIALKYIPSSPSLIVTTLLKSLKK